MLQLTESAILMDQLKVGLQKIWVQMENNAEFKQFIEKKRNLSQQNVIKIKLKIFACICLALHKNDVQSTCLVSHFSLF